MIEIPAWSETALLFLSVALAALVLVWLVAVALRAMHRRAYNLTKVEGARAKRVAPSFTKVDHAARADAMARGDAYERPADQAASAQAAAAQADAKDRFLAGWGGFARVGAFIMAVAHIGLGVVTAFAVAEDAQAQLQRIDCLRDVAARFQIGFVLAGVVVLAETTRFLARRRFGANAPISRNPTAGPVAGA